jgi:hypothetical protein
LVSDDVLYSEIASVVAELTALQNLALPGDILVYLLEAAEADASLIPEKDLRITVLWGNFRHDGRPFTRYDAFAAFDGVQRMQPSRMCNVITHLYVANFRDIDMAKLTPDFGRFSRLTHLALFVGVERQSAALLQRFLQQVRKINTLSLIVLVFAFCPKSMAAKGKSRLRLLGECCDADPRFRWFYQPLKAVYGFSDNISDRWMLTPTGDDIWTESVPFDKEYEG